MDFSLVIPAFIAGILTFLAPCTLPIVPGYLGFISGVASQNFKDTQALRKSRSKVFLNGLFYVIGFSAVFILLGSLFGLGGSFFFQYRMMIARIGGIFIIIFGLFMMGILRLSFLESEKTFHAAKFIKPGNPLSSFIFGTAFAFGWTPCVGPILGAVLTLAASSATVGQGAFLLTIFSAGLAIPFLIIALTIDSAQNYLPKIAKYLKWISFIGGIFLIFLGILLLTNSFTIWMLYAYQLFDFLNYEKLLEYL